MDLIIKDASLDEITAICYRIGVPDFNEQVEAERKYGVVDYLVKHDVKLTDAEAAYDKGLDSTLNAVETAVEAPIKNEAPAEEPKEDLHLERAPEEPQENLGEGLQQLATELVQKKGAPVLVKILKGFGAQSLPELNESHYAAAIEKIKETL